MIAALSQRSRLPISIDSSKAQVAEAALQAGASIVNDVSALSDPAMPELLRRFQAGCIIMHNEQLPPEDEAFVQVFDFLQERLDWARRQTGLSAEYFVLDPGIGFGKTQSQNLSLLKHLGQLRRGLPVLLGVSNKSYIGRICGEQLPGQAARQPGNRGHRRLPGSCDICAHTRWPKANRQSGGKAIREASRASLVRLSVQNPAGHLFRHAYLVKLPIPPAKMSALMILGNLFQVAILTVVFIDTVF